MTELIKEGIFTPSRQSYVAILMIIRKTYTQIFKQVWPFLVYGVFKNSDGSNFKSYIFWFLIALMALSAIYSIIKFFKFYYYIDNQDLVVDSGIIGKNKVTIPFERIQAINIEQNIVHQFFDVVKLKIDTAGSSKKEFELDAISKSKAEEIRAIVLDQKQELVSDTLKEPVLDEVKSILHIDFKNLLKAGLVENHLRSGGLIIAAFVWIGQSLDDIGYDVYEQTEDLGSQYQNLYGFLILLGVFLMVSVTISMVRMVFRNYELKFLRAGDKFKVESGLFNRREVSAKDAKIQSVSWSDNLLKRLLGIYDLTLKQAGSTAVRTKNAINIPATKIPDISFVLNQLYREEETIDIPTKPVSKLYLVRRVLFSSITGLAVISLLYFFKIEWLIYGVLFAIVVITQSILRYKKHQYGWSEEHIYIKGGAFGNKRNISPIYKIQGVKMVQTPFQKRNDLASVYLYNAAGRSKINYLPIEDAARLVDYCLYKVETSQKSWM